MSRPALTPTTTYVIVNTRFVDARREIPYYELDLGPDQAPDARLVTVISRDNPLICRAIELEGSDTRVAVTWRRELDPRGRPRLVLESLA
jgi:hypothetical protein